MPTTEDYLKSLQNDKQNIINNIKTKGVNVPDNATFTDLVGEIENIPTGMTPTGTIDITENGMTDVTKYANANVNVPDGAWNYFVEKTSTQSSIKILYFIKTIPLLNTSNVTNMSSMFNNCKSLTSIPLLDTSNITNMSGMFNNCKSLTSIPLLDTSNVTDMSGMFWDCISLTSIPLLDTSKVTYIYNMFRGCESLTSIPLLDTSNVTNLYDMFYNCYELTDIKGLINLGKAYSINNSENHYKCTLGFDQSSNLTHESLMNIINNLYDIKTKGVKPQSLKLGPTNLAKLTPEEIAIATNKGWNVL